MLSPVEAHPRDDPYQPIAAADVVWPDVPDVDVTGQAYDYVFEGETYEGYVAYPKDADGTLPGVLIAHQYFGLGEMEQFRAEEMAAYGYVAFALDLYGKDNRPIDEEDAQDKLTALRADVDNYQALMVAGLDALKSLTVGPPVDTSALFANGYCAGGEVAFELARLGSPGLIGAAGFHPTLDPLADEYTEALTAAIQAHHAELDSTGDEGLLGFEDEMRARDVSTWSTVKYGNCEHGWTDPTSTTYRAQEASDAHLTMLNKYANILGWSVGGDDSSNTAFIVAVVVSVLAGLLVVGNLVFFYRQVHTSEYVDLTTHE